MAASPSSAKENPHINLSASNEKKKGRSRLRTKFSYSSCEKMIPYRWRSTSLRKIDRDRLSLTTHNAPIFCE